MGRRSWTSVSAVPTVFPAVTAVLVAGLAVLAVRSAATGGPGATDRSVLGWVLDHRGPGVVTLARFVTDTGASPLLFPLVALAGVAVWLRVRSWRPAALALAVVTLGVLGRLLLSKVIQEARPPIEAWAVPVQGYSFPSGHAATSALVAGALAWLLCQLLPARWMRIAVVAALGGWAVLVALSRVYLGVHWLSDVLGSWLFAAACLTLLTLRPRSPVTP
jgi:membrane-associated phospholipid phosphatase